MASTNPTRGQPASGSGLNVTTRMRAAATKTMSALCMAPAEHNSRKTRSKGLWKGHLTSFAVCFGACQPSLTCSSCHCRIRAPTGSVYWTRPAAEVLAMRIDGRSGKSGQKALLAAADSVCRQLLWTSNTCLLQHRTLKSLSSIFQQEKRLFGPKCSFLVSSAHFTVHTA